MVNQEISRLFAKIADALEFKGANRFKVNAYRRGTEVVAALAEELSVVAAENRLTKITGIGKGLAHDITEFLATGEMSAYREATEGIPPTLLDLRRISGLGPKRLALLHEKLGIVDLAGLEAALTSGALSELPGMGAKTAENLREGIERYARHRARMPLPEALALADRVLQLLGKTVDVSGAVFAGSLRRGRETCGDLDLLLPGKDGAAVIRAFSTLPGVERVLASGDTKGSVVFDGARQVDLRVVPKQMLGAALCYFTGSKEHNVRLREIAKKKGLKVNEYGVYRGDQSLAGKTEKEVYAALGLPWIAPELREDRGEIEAARDGSLPKVIEPKQMRGDLHVHTDWGGGRSSIEDLARAAKGRGYAYLAITDHSEGTIYTSGLSAERLLEQAKAVEAARNAVPGIRLLHGVEVDIALDGSLDLPDEVLQRLDWVIAGVHAGLRENVTQRVLRAVDHPLVDAVAHPTGRKLGQRVEYEGYDLDAVVERTVVTGTALEINASPDRLDLSAEAAQLAVSKGAMVVINSDARDAKELDHIELGVKTARRGWIEKSSVVNAGPIRGLRKKARANG